MHILRFYFVRQISLRQFTLFTDVEIGFWTFTLSTDVDYGLMIAYLLLRVNLDNAMHAR